MNNETTDTFTLKTIEALIQSKEHYEYEALMNGGEQAEALIGREPDYALLTKLHDSAEAWKNGEDNYQTDFIEFPAGNSAVLNKAIVSGFFVSIIRIHRLVMGYLEVQS